MREPGGYQREKDRVRVLKAEPNGDCFYTAIVQSGIRVGGRSRPSSGMPSLRGPLSVVKLRKVVASALSSDAVDQYIVLASCDNDALASVGEWASALDFDLDAMKEAIARNAQQARVCQADVVWADELALSVVSDALDCGFLVMQDGDKTAYKVPPRRPMQRYIVLLRERERHYSLVEVDEKRYFTKDDLPNLLQDAFFAREEPAAPATTAPLPTVPVTTSPDDTTTATASPTAVAVATKTSSSSSSSTNPPPPRIPSPSPGVMTRQQVRAMLRLSTELAAKRPKHTTTR